MSILLGNGTDTTEMIPTTRKAIGSVGNYTFAARTSMASGKILFPSESNTVYKSSTLYGEGVWQFKANLPRVAGSFNTSIDSDSFALKGVAADSKIMLGPYWTENDSIRVNKQNSSSVCYLNAFSFNRPDTPGGQTSALYAPYFEFYRPDTSKSVIIVIYEAYSIQASTAANSHLKSRRVYYKSSSSSIGKTSNLLDFKDGSYITFTGKKQYHFNGNTQHVYYSRYTYRISTAAKYWQFTIPMIYTDLAGGTATTSGYFNYYKSSMRMDAALVGYAIYGV